MPRKKKRIQKKIQLEAQVSAEKSILEPSPPKAGRSFWLGLLVAFFIPFIVFLPTLKHDFLNFDDNEYVTENISIQKGFSEESLKWVFTAVHSNNWHPVTWLSHQIDISLFGLKPGGHHFVNVLFHSLNSGLLFAVLVIMTGSIGPALLVVLLFGLHPTHVESVAWIAERKDVLSTFYMMLTFLAYNAYIRNAWNRKWLFYGLALFTLALGLMSKPMLVTLPAVLILLDFWPLNRLDLRKSWAVIWEKIPFFSLALISSYLTFWAQNSAGAVQTVEEFPLMVRVFNASMSYVGYLTKVIWPHPLVIYYPYWKDFVLIKFLAAVFLILAVTLACFWVRRKRPYLLMGWLWYLGTLVPVIGLVQVGNQAMADRYTYITFIGIFIMLSWGIWDMFKLKPVLQKPGLIIISIILLFMTFLTHQQIKVWQNSITVFEHDIKYQSATPLILNNLALAYQDSGQQDPAIKYFQMALAINPKYISVLNNLGSLLTSRGEINEGIKYLQRAIDAEPQNSNNYKVYNNIGIAYIRAGNPAESMPYFEKALDLNPNYYATYNNIGVALEQQGKLTEAIFYYRRGIQRNPFYIGFYNNLGLAYGKTGQLPEAIEAFEAALKINPNFADARRNLQIARDALQNQSQQP